VRRYLALGAVLLVASTFTAPSALADSIVYEKGGNVWLSNPDGTGQHPITSSGGYSKPTQASDGSIVAVRNKLLERMDRRGHPLNLAGDSGGSGPIAPALSPDGSLVAYDYRNFGVGSPGFHTVLSHSTRQTGHDEIFNITGRINPSWIGNDRVLMFDGSESFSGDTQIYTLGATVVQPWYEDPSLSLVGGEVDASQTLLAATDGNVIRLYRLNAPPPAIAVQPACDFINPTGSYFRPTWAPDGRRLAWQDDEGIWVGTPDLTTCANGEAELVIPGAHAPDWGPAAAGRRLAATAPKRIGLNALLNGMRLKVKCDCTVTATLLLAKKPIGKAKKLVLGSATLKLKPNRAGKARLRRGGNSVSVQVGGGGRFVTRKVKIVR